MVTDSDDSRAGCGEEMHAQQSLLLRVILKLNLREQLALLLTQTLKDKNLRTFSLTINSLSLISSTLS